MKFCEACCYPKRKLTAVHYDFCSSEEDVPREYLLELCDECKSNEKGFNTLIKFIQGEVK
jgi:hypothetical protein